MTRIARASCLSRILSVRPPRATIAILALLVASQARGQGFTSAPISTGMVPIYPSVSLAVNSVNGLSYVAYTIGYPNAGEVFYGTRPEGGSWTTEDTQVYASEVSLTTTPFAQGNVVPHLAFIDYYAPGVPVAEGHLLWASRSTGGVWTYETADAGSQSQDGRYAGSPSITLDASNVPRIAYYLTPDSYGRTAGDLVLAKRVGPNNWSTEIVDSVGLSGSFRDITLRMSGGSEVLTYTRYKPTVGKFEFVYRYRSGATWMEELVEPVEANAQMGTMTMPANGLAEVAYMTPGDGLLNYAYRVGANNWVKTKLLRTLTYNVARGIAIIHDAGNHPHIAYYSESGEGVNYASQQTLHWNFQNVAVAYQNWGPLSIGVHSGSPNKPKIAYVGSDGPSGAAQYDLADGTEGSCFDDDRDGWTTCAGDCDDTNPSVRPGATEICGDGIDQNCNGLSDPECCYTVNLRSGRCLMCDSTGEAVCGPGYRTLCCP